MPLIMQIFGYIVLFLSGVAAGILIYHKVLGSAGWAGRFVAKKVEKKFKKMRISLSNDDDRKPNRGHGLRDRSER